MYSPFVPSLPWGTGLGFVLMLTPLMCIPVCILVALLKVSVCVCAESRQCVSMLAPVSECVYVRVCTHNVCVCVRQTGEGRGESGRRRQRKKESSTNTHREQR